MNTVWQKSRARGNGLLVLLAIADDANDDGLAWPSVARIAQKARCSVRHAQRHLKNLIGLTELVLKPRGGPHLCNLYQVTIRHPDDSSDDRMSGVTECQGDKTGGQVVTFPTQGGDNIVTRSVRIRQDPSIEEEGEAGSQQSRSPSPTASARKARRSTQATIDASKARWAALNARVGEARMKKSRGELSESECSALRGMERDLAEIQKKQARGDFS